eukprot:scaffold425911_cov45-Prasinocladus_malaysianus.AAC.1
MGAQGPASVPFVEAGWTPCCMSTTPRHARPPHASARTLLMRGPSAEGSDITAPRQAPAAQEWWSPILSPCQAQTPRIPTAYLRYACWSLSLELVTTLSDRLARAQWVVKK